MGDWHGGAPGGRRSYGSATAVITLGVVRENSAEFLVEFEVNVPDGTSATEVEERENAEASAAARLADEGHLIRVWRQPTATGETTTLGVCTGPTAKRISQPSWALCLSTSGCTSRSPRSSRIQTTRYRPWAMCFRALA